ncbi:flagellar hook-length control protein FliK [Agrobacterium tumefaciens]|uniref:flagellar hook-length control protein FliK n=1 Tax=Agrobacterium tumefaciens TaxID=358 RepID=UPI0022445AA5|nr:flagellar hook-length control protein FliK [Agrobacterium tumefaciens]MCW8056759.1 flagellar hook-length control protein FliK [Agrobacterium tumefaciens]MCW8144112.1 flagellar hook-length control protein FliK [Agrobacterium tumefaciens]
MIDATINAIMNAPPSDPRAGSASVRDDAKGGSFGDALSTVRDERPPQALHSRHQQDKNPAEEQQAQADSEAEKMDVPVKRPATFLNAIVNEHAGEGRAHETLAEFQNAVKTARTPENGKTGKKLKDDTDKDAETVADVIDSKLAELQLVVANAADVATAKTPLEEIAQAIAGKTDTVKSDRAEPVRGKAEHLVKDMPTGIAPAGNEAGSASENEGDASAFRFSSPRSGAARALDMSTVQREGRVEFDARESTGKAADTITVLDSRRFIGLAPSTNASALTGLIVNDPEWVSAMQPGSSLSNAAAQSSTGKVVHTLKLHMTPIELGSVTMSLRLAGDELAVHMTVESVAAYKKLQDDSKNILEGLKAQGLTVDNITISIASSDKSDQTGTQGNNQQNQQAQQQGQQAAAGRNRDESGARGSRQGNGDNLGVHNEGMDGAPGSARSSADNGVYL